MTLDDLTARRLVDVLERIESRLATPSTPLATERRLCTDEEAMGLLGCKRRKLFMLTQQGKIVRVLEGAKASWDVRSIERYLESKLDLPKPRRGRPRKAARRDPEAEAIAKIKVT